LFCFILCSVIYFILFYFFTGSSSLARLYSRCTLTKLERALKEIDGGAFILLRRGGMTAR